MKHKSPITIATGIYLVSWMLIVLGVVPRWATLILAMATAVWMLGRPLEQGTQLFIRLIPFFIALPLTASFDNLNLWRPLSLILCVRLLWEYRVPIREEGKAILRTPLDWLKEHAMTRRLLILGALAILSLVGAIYPITGAIRIIYFINLLLVPIVVYTLVRHHRLTATDLMKDMALATGIIVGIGFLQLATTYLMDVYQFMRMWGEEIQLRQYGAQWSHIAVWLGNTWLAYYGDQLSLRMFSVFPDSHSFPTFILLGLPALFALATKPVMAQAYNIQKRLIYVRNSWLIIFIPLAFLAAILSGTRGIWAAAVGVAGLVILLWWLMPRLHIDVMRRRIFGYLASFLFIFFMLFAVAWPVFVSPQFLLGKGDWGLLGNRVRSILDFGETSNAQRILIWTASVRSIGQHPLLGIGIGNFPVVLKEDIRLADAGSSAHNLYLQVAAEMGIPAALEVMIVFGTIWFAAWHWFRRADRQELAYSAMLLIFLPWVYAYVLTDPILFDERVFLIFGTVTALIWASKMKRETRN